MHTRCSVQVYWPYTFAYSRIGVFTTVWTATLPPREPLTILGGHNQLLRRPLTRSSRWSTTFKFYYESTDKICCFTDDLVYTFYVMFMWYSIYISLYGPSGTLSRRPLISVFVLGILTPRMHEMLAVDILLLLCSFEHLVSSVPCFSAELLYSYLEFTPSPCYHMNNTWNGGG